MPFTAESSLSQAQVKVTKEQDNPPPSCAPSSTHSQNHV
jgi:hypothetical protein